MADCSNTDGYRCADFLKVVHEKLKGCFYTIGMAYKDPRDPRKTLSRRRHYLKNKERYISNAKRSKLRMRVYVRSKKKRPCANCSIKYPYYVMQFDHISDKEYTIATLVNFNNRVKIDYEIAKCEVVCANCHAERTHQRGIV